jgi:hypothetical protein
VTDEFKKLLVLVAIAVALYLILLFGIDVTQG